MPTPLSPALVAALPRERRASDLALVALFSLGGLTLALLVALLAGGVDLPPDLLF